MSNLMMLFALECILLIEMILTILKMYVEQKQTTQYVFYIIDSFYAIDNTIYLMLYTLAVERNLHAFLKKTA